MIDCIRCFLHKTKEHGHVLQLIKETDSIMISFIANNETISLSIKKGEITLLQDSEEVFNKYEIYGDFAAIEQLLTGKDRLRNLVKREKLTIAAPFRRILMLESLFYLIKGTENRLTAKA